ncbi:MIC13 protein, partial [Halcyon senegalensis]|nr:MIC13 protein [Halcyon senegalensis]
QTGAALGSCRFVIKGGLAGAAVYVAYDQGLLGSGKQGAEALKKARAALPPAIQEWTSYVGWEVRAAPRGAGSKTNALSQPGEDTGFSFAFLAGVQTVMAALSVAPTRACEYTEEGWKYVKDLVK